MVARLCVFAPSRPKGRGFALRAGLQRLGAVAQDELLDLAGGRLGQRPELTPVVKSGDLLPVSLMAPAMLRRIGGAVQNPHTVPVLACHNLVITGALRARGEEVYLEYLLSHGFEVHDIDLECPDAVCAERAAPAPQRAAVPAELSAR